MQTKQGNKAWKAVSAHEHARGAGRLPTRTRNRSNICELHICCKGMCAFLRISWFSTTLSYNKNSTRVWEELGFTSFTAITFVFMLTLFLRESQVFLASQVILLLYRVPQCSAWTTWFTFWVIVRHQRCKGWKFFNQSRLAKLSKQQITKWKSLRAHGLNFCEEILKIHYRPQLTTYQRLF